jgi:hypothetical protein
MTLASQGRALNEPRLTNGLADALDYREKKPNHADQDQTDTYRKKGYHFASSSGRPRARAAAASDGA